MSVQILVTKKDELQVKTDDIKIISPEDAVALLLSLRIIVGCWNKIYKRDFIKQYSLKFSSTLFYGEGLFFITNAAQYANCVGVGNRKVYYYRRNSEFSATTNCNIEKMRNGEKALRSIRDNIKIDSEKIDIMWNLHMSLFSLGAVTRMKTYRVASIYNDEFAHWRRILLNDFKNILFSRYVSIYRKLMIMAGIVSPALVAKVDIIRRKRISTSSVM